MNRFVGCRLVVTGGVGGCIFAYYLLSFVVAAAVAERLPAPAQGAAWAWDDVTLVTFRRYWQHSQTRA